MLHPALIVGGGPAGSAAAVTLAKAGREALLIERSTGPHDSVCGGFLGWDALAALREIGVDAFALGAQPIRRLRLFGSGRRVEIDLPHIAAGLSRRILDEALIKAASAAGATIRRGRTVRAADPHTRSIRFDDGENMTGEALLLATGKYDLRGLARDLGGRKEPPSVGLRAALPPGPARLRDLDGMIELHLFDQGYAGLLLQEDGAANLCLSVARSRLSAAGNADNLMAEILVEAPDLSARMGNDVPARFEAVAGVPYGWRAQESLPGVFRIGDQGAVIASLAGDGIAIAITSGISAARALLAGGPDAAMGWQRRMHAQNRRPLRVAEILRHGAANPVGRSLLMRLLQWMPQLGERAALLTRVDGYC